MSNQLKIRISEGRGFDQRAEGGCCSDPPPSMPLIYFGIDTAASAWPSKARKIGSGGVVAWNMEHSNIKCRDPEGDQLVFYAVDATTFPEVHSLIQGCQRNWIKDADPDDQLWNPPQEAFYGKYACSVMKFKRGQTNQMDIVFTINGADTKYSFTLCGQWHESAIDDPRLEAQGITQVAGGQAMTATLVPGPPVVGPPAGFPPPGPPAEPPAGPPTVAPPTVATATVAPVNPYGRFFANVATKQNRDYVIIVDESGSMKRDDKDKNGLPTTRWANAASAVTALAPKITSFDSDGITLWFFSNPGKQEKWDNIKDADRVNAIFRENCPEWGMTTDLAGVLASAFGEYFNKKDQGGDGCKPVTYLIITDGAPDSREDVKSVIEDASSKLDQDSDMSLTFVQVGDDEGATKYLQSLDDELKCKFDIVDTVKDDDIKRMGFEKLIELSIQD